MRGPRPTVISAALRTRRAASPGKKPTLPTRSSARCDFFPSPRLRGEVTATSRRVRGSLHKCSAFVEAASHSNPLPAKCGARGQSGQHASSFAAYRSVRIHPLNPPEFIRSGKHHMTATAKKPAFTDYVVKDISFAEFG